MPWVDGTIIDEPERQPEPEPQDETGADLSKLDDAEPANEYGIESTPDHDTE